MARSTRISTIVGALVGAVLGLAVVALAAGRVLDSGVGFVSDRGAPAPAFVVGQAGMYLLVAVAGAIGGGIVGLIGYAIARETDRDTPRFGAGPMAVVSAAIGSSVGFGLFRALTGSLGDVVEGVVTVAVFRAIVVALVTGALTGSITAAAIDRLSRMEIYGFTGAAWPTPAAFIRDAAAAVGLPLLGIVGGAGAIYVFSKLLLASDTNLALVLFGGVGAVILFGAAAAAAIGTRRSHRSD